MLRGNWGKRLAAWLIALSGFALASYGLLYGLSEQGRYTKVANQAAAEYAAHTAKQIKHSCLVLAGPEEAECFANAKNEYQLKRRDNRREYDDLVAQQRSALWTGVMGIAAITGMILSVIGVYLIFGTFRETRKQVGLLKEAQRPDIHFIKLGLHYRQAGGHTNVRERAPPPESFVPLIAHNFGAGSATVENVRYGYAVANDVPQRVDYAREAAVPTGSTILPGRSTPNALSLIELSQDEIDQLQAGAHLYFWVRGQFKDNLGGHHAIGLAAVWMGDPLTQNVDMPFEQFQGSFWAKIPDRPDLNFRRVVES